MEIMSSQYQDYRAIELRARALRAEAVKHVAASTAAWVKSFFVSAPKTVQPTA